MTKGLTVLIVLFSSGVARGGLLTNFAASFAQYQACTMIGADFDVDRDIDGTDFLQWQRGVGSVGLFINAHGDADKNSYVNQLDMTQWRSQFGADLTGLPESSCFKLFLDPEGIIEGSVTVVIDVPIPSPGQSRLALGPDTRIIDVHPEYSAQVVTQTILTSLTRQRLEVNVAFSANNATNPPAGPVTIFGFQAPDLTPELGLDGVVTQFDFRSGDTVTLFDPDTGQTTTFNDTQLTDVSPPIMAPLTLTVNTVTGDVSMHNPASGGTLMPIDLNYYEITSLAGALNPGGWVSLDDGEGDPPGVGWDEAGGANARALSESRFSGSLTLTNAQSQSLGAAYKVASGVRDLRFFYGTPNGSLIPGEINYVTGMPGAAVPEPGCLGLALLGLVGLASRRRPPFKAVNGAPSSR